MTSDDIAVTLDQGVATLTICRPPHNYFDPPLVTGLVETALFLSADPATRCVVLCSEGRSFCAGANFGGGKKTGGGPTAEGGGPARAGRPEHIYEDAARLFDVEVPIVAAVQGAAIGGGLGLAMACDFRVATPRARFVANFAALGIHHGFGLSVTLPRVVGNQRAERMLLAGQQVSGEEAMAIGLCDLLVPEEDLMPAVDKFAHEIAELAPLAVRSIKRTLRQGIKEEVLSAIDREINEQNWLFRTADHREGAAALAEKRAPVFKAQ
jgi:enoyl-CoA hydratase/carnithine racemase